MKRANTLFNKTDFASVNFSQTSGFRLKRLELLNWGTFDQQVHTVSPEGQSTLLVGQNGSGKSTLVDAILTLLVKPGVRNFNVAAGAKKRERTERTYFEGAFDRNADGDSDGIKTRCLRPKKKHYSVILACFQNGVDDAAFSLAQVLYWNGQKVDKIYCFSDGDRTITGDFSQLDSSDGILKAIKDRDFKATKTFTEYEGWFRKITKVKKKAMDVFNQTVAVKDIENLNEFIRNHMLEPQNWSERLEALLAHFTQLNEAHACLVKVRDQEALLAPVARHGQEYARVNGQLEKAVSKSQGLDAFFAQKAIEVFEPALERFQQSLVEVRKRKQSLKEELNAVEEEQRRIKNEIEHEGGDRLKTIPLLIETATSELKRKQERHDQYQQALNRTGLTQIVSCETDFQDVHQLIPEQHRQLDTALKENEEKKNDLIVHRAQIRNERNELVVELESLDRQKGNLPEWSISLRENICQELGLSEKELPFAAELIAVQEKEQDWESSIEKVLHSFGLSLLVPDRYYHMVSRHVEQTKLTARGRGQRLIYLRINEHVTSRETTNQQSNSMLSKLRYKDGHALLPWLKAELASRFDYRCCETIEELQQASGLAMTSSRHVKTGSKRHDKDDREQLLNRRNFILGWDNKEKRQRISAKIAELNVTEQQLSQYLADIDADLVAIRTRIHAWNDLRAFGHYSEIDWQQHQQNIVDLEAEKKSIEENSDAIQYLREQAAKLASKRIGLETQREGAIRDESRLEQSIQDAERLIFNAQNAIDDFKKEDVWEQFRFTFDELESSVDENSLTIEELLKTQDSLRKTLDKEQIRLRKKLDPIAGQLTLAMSKFTKKFSKEADLLPQVAYLDSFLGLRQRIIDEDLPRHTDRFKERLNDTVTREIGLFRAALEKERRNIEDKIETLNLSLRQLDFREGTYIQLEPNRVNNHEIIEFQRQLRECVEGSFEDSAEANEARFVRIQKLVLKLQDEGHRRWRDKVVDVRNWFDFLANVIDESTLQQVSSYDDSTGQSGGEKAKLAFTILVAAIAFQYDLDPSEPDEQRFRFVVVDEMFSKVDDQHAEYALKLFRQFGLQLLIVAPLDAKACVTQPFVGSYLHVTKKNNRSEVFQMTAKEFAHYVDAADGARIGNSQNRTER
ncbi:ATP-binding protein [Thalassoglobus polymorphus]|uniref:Chromosome segregation protein n=1 Tax=Thalassoglobus polymorphus TaxID=2527994 RepID=A0A517QK34_9PLAN|nr:ATP-binding protein [Thalassoglobus polymorphus]QDT32001.1 chromosome segregation protein [Thalassoglobus polymorphus]